MNCLLLFLRQLVYIPFSKFLFYFAFSRSLFHLAFLTIILFREISVLYCVSIRYALIYYSSLFLYYLADISAGALCRWQLSRFNPRIPSFPLGTFTANILATLILATMNLIQGRVLFPFPYPIASHVPVSSISSSLFPSLTKVLYPLSLFSSPLITLPLSPFLGALINNRSVHRSLSYTAQSFMELTTASADA